jgi:hypothetical protein
MKVSTRPSHPSLWRRRRPLGGLLSEFSAVQAVAGAGVSAPPLTQSCATAPPASVPFPPEAPARTPQCPVHLFRCALAVSAVA